MANIHKSNCTSTEIQKIIKMKDRVREKVFNCDPMTVKMLDSTLLLLEDTKLSKDKMCGTDYASLRHQLTTLATKFSNDCDCTKKKSNF